jgi:hypothetical protein
MTFGVAKPFEGIQLIVAKKKILVGYEDLVPLVLQHIFNSFIPPLIQHCSYKRV